ncbi:MAG: MOSC domain-containing protein [Verrucomicrobiota bacterium]
MTVEKNKPLVNFSAMKESSSFPMGQVGSLHLHPAESGGVLQDVKTIELETDKGIINNPRHFARHSRSGGFSKRQVSLMEREQIAKHASDIGWDTITPGLVRSNIETIGVDLISLIGRRVRIGTAVLFLYEARTPCWQMDKIFPGLRKLMEKNRQGVLSQVIASGIISVGDEIALSEDDSANKARSNH